MDVLHLEQLAILRAIVGYLGERGHCAWWQSAFFASGSQAFLAPLFARTQLLAQCNGVTQAACLIHDERIGVGQVYHLFRLSEDMEQGIHRLLNDDEVCKRVKTPLANREMALASLRDMTDRQEIAGIGPIRVSATSNLRSMEAWTVAAAHYLHAFEHGSQVYPYFRDSA